MSVGFKRSLFGFNRKQVIEYLENLDKNLSGMDQKDITEEVEETENIQIIEPEAEENIIDKNNELDDKIQELNEKFACIERLYENMLKLNDLAQENAKTILENSEKSYRNSADEINNNLYTIDEAHNSLKLLRDNIEKTSADFSNRVDSLIKSLLDTRDKISNNSESAQKAKDKFDEEFFLL